MSVARDLQRWRTDTPGCEGRVHLNNAGAALMPLPVVAAIQQHLAREAEIGGYEAAEEARNAIADGYAAIATLIGGESRNIAIVENATVAVAQALGVFDFSSGDRIITSRADYVSNQLM